MTNKSPEDPQFLRKKLKMVSDDMLIHRELYNPNKFDLVWNRDMSKTKYILEAGIPLGPSRIHQRAESHAHFNHGFYIGKAMNGAPSFDCVVIFGNAIGTGLKNPSRPD